MRHFRPVPNVSKGERLEMKVTLPEEKVFNKKQIAIYITIIVICIISIIIAFYVQFYARIDIFGVEPESQIGKKTVEQIEELQAGFDQIFTNNIYVEEGERQDNKKIETESIIFF